MVLSAHCIVSFSFLVVCVLSEMRDEMDLYVDREPGASDMATAGDVMEIGDHDRCGHER